MASNLQAAGASGPLAVEVALIPNREGQVMRSVLRRRFAGAAVANYRLDVALAQASAVTAIDAAGDVDQTSSDHDGRLAALALGSKRAKAAGRTGACCRGL